MPESKVIGDKSCDERKTRLLRLLVAIARLKWDSYNSSLRKVSVRNCLSEIYRSMPIADAGRGSKF
jgi:hypothetical protein